jgi:beta-N-acetylhexosaminidase
MTGDLPAAVIFGLAGPALTADERRLFACADPLGFILFRRNCQAPDQVRALVADLRRLVGRGDAPVLIDQEGGRVQRLAPPHWRAAPAAAAFGRLHRLDPLAAREAAYLQGRLLAAELADLCISHDCWPLLDVPQPDADGIIGDRAFASDPRVVAGLAAAAAEGLLAGGVLPIVKHIPGHGRATLDSHLALPVVEATAEALAAVDLVPFQALAAMPWAMTAHVVFTAHDPAQPATTSAAVIGQVIRRHIGFRGVLVSDDLCMRALSGTPAARATAALAAGCDVLLHCSGDPAEMAEIAAVTPPLTSAAAARLAAAEAMRRRPDAFDRAAGEARLAARLAPVGGALAAAGEAE